MAAVIRQHNSAVMRGARTVQKTLPVKSLATAGTKTDAHWTVCARFTPSSTRPPLLLEKTRGITPAWLHKLSNYDSIPTSGLFGTRSARAAWLCPSTSGPWKTKTPTLRSRGKCGRRPQNTRTQLVDAIYVSLRSWQSSWPKKKDIAQQKIRACVEESPWEPLSPLQLSTSNILKPVSDLSQHQHVTKNRFLWATHQFYDHLSSPVFLSVSHHTSLFFPPVFFPFVLFPTVLSHCFFSQFFPSVSHPSSHPLTPVSTAPPPPIPIYPRSCHSDSHTPYEVFLNKFLWPMCWSFGVWLEWGSGLRTFKFTAPLENLVLSWVSYRRVAGDDCVEILRVGF